MLRIFLIFILLLQVTLSYSQVLKGTIKDVEGQPVQYGTVYIQEIRQGTTANAKGDYEIKLQEGKYTVVYQSLGFEPEIKNVTIGKTPVTINVVLQVQFYEIPEVRITASGEDPAYGIMRKVIGMAPYYLNHVKHYKAEVYLKGNLYMKKIPKIIQRQINVEAKNNSSGASYSSNTIKQGDTYMMESVNEITFNAPDKYVQRVLSSRSTFPDQGNEISPMDFVQGSFYEPVIQDMFISPLSPDAFFHYRFKYLGLSTQGNFIINKIQVSPKRKSQQLFDGTIYIVEDLWCLHSIDLNNENIAGKIRVQQLYVPFQEDVWMPVSLKFDVNIAIIGVKADAGYGSSIKYNEVEINKELKKPATLTFGSNRKKPVPDTTKTKTTQEIERILAKNELSNRDMAKLSGLMKKQSEEATPDSVKNSLEIKEETTYIIEKDANKKDSAYWAEIRPIPLSENEIKSIRVADSVKGTLSLRNSPSDTTKQEGKKKSGFIRTGKWIVSGHTWSDTTGFRFTNGGLIDPKNLSFNTVDGFVYGVDFRLSKSWKQGKSFTISPDIKYAFSREKVMWRVFMQYNFRKEHANSFTLRAGVTSKDFASGGGINPFLNSVTSLFLEKNYMKLYEDRYLYTGYFREITNGLSFNAVLNLDDRRILDNFTDFSFVKRSISYTDNIPDNQYLENPVEETHLLRDHRHADLTINISYTPKMKYVMRGKTKYPAGSDYPTFSLTYRHGYNLFSGLTDNTWHYDMLRIEASKSRDIGAMSELSWRYRAGTFLQKKGFSYIDFFHFNSQPFPVLLNDYSDGFMLPKYYSLSTPEYFSEAHIKYTTPYLLVKLLPLVSKTLMRENLSLAFLWSKFHTAYTEIGYSLSEFLLLGEVGIYAGFDNLRFSGVGGKIVLRFN